MRKILLFDISLGLAEGFSGGTIRYYELLRLIFQSRAWNITVCTTSGGKKSIQRYFEQEKDILQSLNFVNVRASLFLKKEPFFLFRAWSYLVSMIHLRLILGSMKRKHQHFDLLYTPSDFFYEVVPAVWFKKKKVVQSIVGISHSLYIEPAKRRGCFLLNWAMYQLQQLSYRRFACYYDEFFTLDVREGHEIGRIVTSYGFKKEIHYIHNGFDVEELVSTPVYQGKESFDLIHIGMRLAKGFFDIPEIVSEIKKDIPTVKIALMGVLPYDLEKEFFKEVNKYGVRENILFLGYLGKERFGYLKKAQVFFAPSHEESWGIAVGEAMLCGLPVVAYRLESYEDVYGEVIRYVPCFDKKYFAKEVVNLLKNPAERERLAKKGLDKASYYRWENVLQKDMQILRELRK